MLVPDVELLLVLADEAEELHQCALRLEVKVMVLKDIFSAVGYFQKRSRSWVALRHRGLVPISWSIHPPAANGQEVELTVGSRRDEVLKEGRAGVDELWTQRQAICSR